MTFIKLITLIALFTTIENREAVRLIKTQSGKLFFEFQSNKAAAYILNDGKVIVLPENGDSSLLFAEKKDFDTFLANPEFPAPIDDLYFAYKQQLLNVEQNISFFYNEVNEVLRDSMTAGIRTGEDLNKLIEHVNKFLEENRNFNSKLFVSLGIVLGEYLKKKYDLRWSLSTIYTFQPYYIPLLCDKNNYEFRLWSILDEYFENKRFDLSSFIKRVDLYIRQSKRNLQE